MPVEDCSRKHVPGEYIVHKSVFLRRTLLFECGRSNTQSSTVGEGGPWEEQQGR